MSGLYEARPPTGVGGPTSDLAPTITPAVSVADSATEPGATDGAATAS